MMIPPFERFVENPFSGRLITFDPGETTGYSIWDDSVLIEAGQLNTHTVKSSVLWMGEWLDLKCKHHKDALAVMEEYRVYSWKTQDHAQSTMHTSRFIGCLETLLVQRGIPYVMQGAGMAKPFATDPKLKAWGFYDKYERHSRDAIRHGVYYLCKGKPYKEGSIQL